jgi:hypothetical protein
VPEGIPHPTTLTNLQSLKLIEKDDQGNFVPAIASRYADPLFLMQRAVSLAECIKVAARCWRSIPVREEARSPMQLPYDLGIPRLTISRARRIGIFRLPWQNRLNPTDDTPLELGKECEVPGTKVRNGNAIKTMDAVAGALSDRSR